VETTPAGEEAKRREIRQPGLERGEEGAVVGRGGREFILLRLTSGGSTAATEKPGMTLAAPPWRFSF
jgi:hypothetical protein